MVINIAALKDRISHTEFELAVQNLIDLNFEDSRNFSVAEERRKYKASVDEGIWKQNKGLKPHVCEVYYKGEYLMDIPSDMQPDDALALLRDRSAYINREKEKANA